MAKKFLNKMGEFFGGAATTGVTSLVDSAVKAIDTFVVTPEDRLKAERLKADIALQAREHDLVMEKLKQELKMAYLTDKQSARTMFAHDSSTQKTLTIVFTVGFFALTGFLLALLFKALDLELSSFTSLFIGSVFGAFASIMVQIISFYFGSSQTGENQAEKMTEAFGEATKQSGINGS